MLSAKVYDETPVTTSAPVSTVPQTTEEQPTTVPQSTATPTTVIVEPTTTGEPTTTTAPTTTEAPDLVGTFYVSTVSMLPCIEDESQEMTLYYSGAFGLGTVMYVDFVGGSQLTGYTFIKKESDISVYAINSETGVVGAIAYSCEI